MRYLVDGYNLMYVSKEHQPFRKGNTLEGCRETLIHKLVQYAAAQKVSITVVFDGRGGETITRRAGLDVVFASGPGGADSEIIRRVERASNRKILTVVSSDREVATHARQLGATSVRSGAFMREMERAGPAVGNSSDESEENVRPPSDEDTEFWMGIFGDEKES